jgi:hypothetical protein
MKKYILPMCLIALSIHALDDSFVKNNNLDKIIELEQNEQHNSFENSSTNEFDNLDDKKSDRVKMKKNKKRKKNKQKTEREDGSSDRSLMDSLFNLDNQRAHHIRWKASDPAYEEKMKRQSEFVEEYSCYYLFMCCCLCLQ